MLEGRLCHPGVQRGLDKLEKWICMSFMKFSKAKRQVLHLDRGSPRHSHSLAGVVIHSSPAEKDLNMSQWNPGACIKSSVASMVRVEILPLHSALLRSTWSVASSSGVSSIRTWNGWSKSRGPQSS
ncbi:hypothetical protein TURU_034063 [Turdus rufiventris]|nr:hypothetical protein TURU_034063 [Turdus rufiventris]